MHEIVPVHYDLILGFVTCLCLDLILNIALCAMWLAEMACIRISSQILVGIYV